MRNLASLAGTRGCNFPLLVEPCSYAHVLIPGFCYSETKLNNTACVVFNNEACVTCESDVVAFSVSNHVIKFN